MCLLISQVLASGLPNLQPMVAHSIVLMELISQKLLNFKINYCKRSYFGCFMNEWIILAFMQGLV